MELLLRLAWFGLRPRMVKLEGEALRVLVKLAGLEVPWREEEVYAACGSMTRGPHLKLRRLRMEGVWYVAVRLCGMVTQRSGVLVLIPVPSPPARRPPVGHVRQRQLHRRPDVFRLLGRAPTAEDNPHSFFPRAAPSIIREIRVSNIAVSTPDC